MYRYSLYTVIFSVIIGIFCGISEANCLTCEAIESSPFFFVYSSVIVILCCFTFFGYLLVPITVFFRCRSLSVYILSAIFTGLSEYGFGFYICVATELAVLTVISCFVFRKSVLILNKM